MKTLDFVAILKDFSYKPNFAIGAYEVDGEWRIRISMAVEDARKPLEPWVLKPMPQDENYFFNDYARYRPPPSNSIGYSPSREMTEVMGNFIIPPFVEQDGEESFLKWLMYSIKEVELHEMDEWARYKGELLHDPHEEVTANV